MKNWMSLTLGFCLLVFVAGCGGDDDGDGGSCSSDNECKGDRVCQNGSCVSPGANNANNQQNNANNQQNNVNNTEAFCCLNGSFFDCNGDSNAAQACFNNFDPGSCQADSSRDGECNSNNVNNVNNVNNMNGGDVGDSCRADADCSTDLCLFDAGAVVGYCTSVCQSFSDCPSFWDCEEVGNGSGTYCVNNG